MISEENYQQKFFLNICLTQHIYSAGIN